MKIWNQHLARNDIIIMVNQAVWSIKLTELLLLFCSKWVWLTKQLGLPGYVVTRNCGKIWTSKKPSKLYNYQLKGVRSFLTQKESGSDWECIVLAGSSSKKPSILYNYQLKGVRSFSHKVWVWMRMHSFGKFSCSPISCPWSADKLYCHCNFIPPQVLIWATRSMDQPPKRKKRLGTSYLFNFK